MSKRKETVTINELTKSEKVTLWLAPEALKRTDKHVSVYVHKNSIDISIHPWSEERSGRWIARYAPTGNPGEYCAEYRCSVCGERNTKSAYCPNCGARMEVSGDE